MLRIRIGLTASAAMASAIPLGDERAEDAIRTSLGCNESCAERKSSRY
jgi:hypothetical protein